MSFTRWLLNMVSGQKTQLTEVTPQVQSKKKVFCHTHVIKFKPFRFVSCRKDYFCWKKPKYISVSFFLLIYGPRAKLTKINGEYFYNDTLTCKKSYTSRKRMYHLARVGELNVLLRPNLSGFISASSFQKIQSSFQYSMVVTSAWPCEQRDINPIYKNCSKNSADTSSISSAISCSYTFLV